MRIVQVCPYAWEAPGGVQVHVRQLADALRERGHEVLILSPGAASAGEPGVAIVGRPVRIPYAGTVAPICFSRSSWVRIRGALARFAPDVVHAHEPMSPSSSMLATLAAKSPVVATFHSYLERSRLLEAAAPLLRVVWRRLDGRIAVSRAAAAFVAGAFPGEVEIVPNGVAVERFGGPTEPDPDRPAGRTILWVGRLDPQKGFPVMIRAFHRLASQLSDVRLVVAGDGRDRDALRLLPDAERRRVVMLGAVPNDRLPALQAAADVYVSAATGQESFGYVLVEAMAAGLPVVATDIPGYREVVRDGIEGLLVPPGDPGSLARAVREVLNDPALAARLGAAGRTRAGEYAWSLVVPRIEAVYGRALGRP